jgi:serine/threonine-protein kinase
VVHRDLKPENVFIANINGARIPKLVDFGISKVRISGGDEAEAITETAVGVMLGTPPYMAPELVRGAREADPRSDVWALGVIMYELLTGTLPFNGRNVRELFERISTAEPPQISSLASHVPRHISEVIAKCLRKDPASRYPDGAALAAGFAAAREKIATAKRLREQRAALIGMAETVRSEPESGPVSVEVRTADRREPLLVVPDPSEMTVKRRRPATSSPSARGRIAGLALAVALVSVLAVVAILLTRGRF